MKQKKEQLIKELEKQLYQYTYQDKDIAPEKIEAICNLLEVLKPQDGKEAKEEESYLRFQAMCSEQKEKRNAEKCRRIKTYQKIFMGIAATFFFVIVLNFGAYATEQKSFFDIMMEGRNGIGFLVTGNETTEKPNEADVIQLETSNYQSYSSWDEVQEKVAESIIIPREVPAGFELKEITLNKLDNKKMLKANYRNEEKNNYIMIEIEIYEDQVTATKLFVDDKWQLIKEKEYGDVMAQFYELEKDNFCYFFKEEKIYRVSSDLSIEELEEKLSSMML